MIDGLKEGDIVWTCRPTLRMEIDGESYNTLIEPYLVKITESQEDRFNGTSNDPLTGVLGHEDDDSVNTALRKEDVYETEFEAWAVYVEEQRRHAESMLRDFEIQLTKSFEAIARFDKMKRLQMDTPKKKGGVKR